MSNERDELAEVIKPAAAYDFWPQAAAEFVLAAGYRKPRTITTAEELEWLPFESVIRDAQGHILERWGGPDEYLWATVMVSKFIPSSDIALPATLIHEGTE